MIVSFLTVHLPGALLAVGLLVLAVGALRLVVSASGSGRPSRAAMTVTSLGAAAVGISALWGPILNAGLEAFGADDESLLRVADGSNLLVDLGLSVQVATIVIVTLAALTAIAAIILNALIGLSRTIGSSWRQDTQPATAPGDIQDQDPHRPAAGTQVPTQQLRDQHPGIPSS